MDPQPRECSIANALSVIGERWSLLALREVFFGVYRFDDIAKNTGASRDILSTRLKKLVDRGVLQKVQYHDRPARFEYHLTEAGKALHTVLLTLLVWGDRYVTQGPPPVTWEHSCGAALDPVLTCAACGQAVSGDAGKLTVRTS